MQAAAVPLPQLAAVLRNCKPAGGWLSLLLRQALPSHVTLLPLVAAAAALWYSENSKPAAECLSRPSAVARLGLTSYTAASCFCRSRLLCFATASQQQSGCHAASPQQAALLLICRQTCPKRPVWLPWRLCGGSGFESSCRQMSWRAALTLTGEEK
jgi:hypothetical protein